jgi:hypothetical protein
MGARGEQSFQGIGHVLELLHAFGCEVCGRGERLGGLVGEAGGDGFTAAHPGLLLEEGLDLVGGLAGFLDVGADQAVLDLVEEVGVAAHLVGVATLNSPGLVHHHHGVLGHVDGVAGHGDDRGHRGGKAVDVDVDRGRMAVEQVVDGHALEDVAARRVDAQVDTADVAEGLEVVGKAPGADAPAADLFVDEDLGVAGAFGLDAVPAVRCLGVAVDRRHCHRHGGEQGRQDLAPHGCLLLW